MFNLVARRSDLNGVDLLWDKADFPQGSLIDSSNKLFDVSAGGTVEVHPLQSLVGELCSGNPVDVDLGNNDRILLGDPLEGPISLRFNPAVRAVGAQIAGVPAPCKFTANLQVWGDKGSKIDFRREVSTRPSNGSTAAFMGVVSHSNNKENIIHIEFNIINAREKSITQFAINHLSVEV